MLLTISFCNLHALACEMFYQSTNNLDTMVEQCVIITVMLMVITHTPFYFIIF